MFKVGIIAFVMTFSLLSYGFESNTLYRGENGEMTQLQNIVNKVERGSIVIVSELHNSQAHHDHQLEFLRELKKVHPDYKISVGMEFFEFPDQVQVNHYLSGLVSEADFLKNIGWTQSLLAQLNVFSEFSVGVEPLLFNNFSYDFYRPLVLFPKETNGWVYALNAPRSLSSRIAKVGIENLTDVEKKLLPPNFQIGQDLYKERFREIMGGGHHLPEEKFNRYFAAQSVWDDTMAWQAVLAQKSNPDQVLVIIVGDFHNSYGGGLPDRIKARVNDQKVVTISQVSIKDRNKNEQAEEILPHSKWGVRADFVWTD